MAVKFTEHVSSISLGSQKIQRVLRIFGNHLLPRVRQPPCAGTRERAARPPDLDDLASMIREGPATCPRGGEGGRPGARTSRKARVIAAVSFRRTFGGARCASRGLFHYPR